MIHVTSGHEKGIGLEVFLKSFILLSKKEQETFTLHVSKDVLKENLDLLNLKYSFSNESLLFCSSKLSLCLLNTSKFESTASLESALEKISSPKDILFTLPTSKDQLVLDDQNPAGYTEYLRKKYKIKNLVMCFDSDQDLTFLITDHISLKEVANKINKELIHSKISTFLRSYSFYFKDINKIIVAGINPHVGEGGILGSEDECIEGALTTIKKENNDLNVIGPVSGDTLHFYRGSDNEATVYMYHDQGLPVFKSHNHTIGANITLGLPFLRLSVDHGTAFELYGKNKANIQGCFFCLKKSLKAHKKLRA